MDNDKVKNALILSILVIMILAFLIRYIPELLSDESEIERYCRETYIAYSKCPFDKCRSRCGPAPLDFMFGCKMECVPKECWLFGVDDCPESICSVITDCEGLEECTYPNTLLDC